MYMSRDMYMFYEVDWSIASQLSAHDYLSLTPLPTPLFLCTLPDSDIEAWPSMTLMSERLEAVVVYRLRNHNSGYATMNMTVGAPVS